VRKFHRINHPIDKGRLEAAVTAFFGRERHGVSDQVWPSHPHPTKKARDNPT